VFPFSLSFSQERPPSFFFFFLFLVDLRVDRDQLDTQRQQASHGAATSSVRWRYSSVWLCSPFPFIFLLIFLPFFPFFLPFFYSSALNYKTRVISRQGGKGSMQVRTAFCSFSSLKDCFLPSLFFPFLLSFSVLA